MGRRSLLMKSVAQDGCFWNSLPYCCLFSFTFLWSMQCYHLIGDFIHCCDYCSRESSRPRRRDASWERMFTSPRIWRQWLSRIDPWECVSQGHHRIGRIVRFVKEDRTVFFEETKQGPDRYGTDRHGIYIYTSMHTHIKPSTPHYNKHAHTQTYT